MKLAKNFAAVSLLVFTFALSAFAGDQQTPGSPNPPPPPPPPHMRAALRTETSEITTNVPGTLEEAQETSDIFWYQALLGLLSIY